MDFKLVLLIDIVPGLVFGFLDLPVGWSFAGFGYFWFFWTLDRWKPYHLINIIKVLVNPI
jgi:hypothetical protein